MSTSRRHLIKMGMCATAALTVSFDALFPDDALASPAYDSPPVDDGFVVRRDMFEACIGHYVRVAYGPRSVRLWIVQVEDLPSARATQTVGHPDGFTVLLRGPLAAPLAQGTYRIDSPTLGTFSLFLVPGVVRGAMTYAAVFNRFVPAA